MEYCAAWNATGWSTQAWLSLQDGRVGAFSTQTEKPQKDRSSKTSRGGGSSGSESPDSSRVPGQKMASRGPRGRGRGETPPPRRPAAQPGASPLKHRPESSPGKGRGEKNAGQGRHAQKSPARDCRQQGQRREGKSPLRAPARSPGEESSSAEAKPRGPTTDRRKKSWSLVSQNLSDTCFPKESKNVSVKLTSPKFHTWQGWKEMLCAPMC